MSVDGPEPEPGRPARVPREVLAARHAVSGALTDLPGGSLVLVACSGGADSLALAAATAWVGPRLGLRVGAVTVDHGLQHGSSDRAEAVARGLAAAGLDPVEVESVQVGAGQGPEDAARRARYAALEAVADRVGALAVLLGHTLDDQAETVLLRLARGSGSRSLSGMRPVHGRLRRPFLGLRRVQVRAAAAAAGLKPWEDPHNVDRSYLRPRLRHDVLPALEDALGPGVVPALARTADLARADADALEEWADRACEQALPTRGAGLEVSVLGDLPDAVRTRVLRRAALAAGSPAGSLTREHVRALDALVTDWHGQGQVALPGGVSVLRDRGRLLLGRGAAPAGAAAARHEETGGR